jgi:hypothetical protein
VAAADFRKPETELFLTLLAGGVHTWQIWWQIGGQRGISGDPSQRGISNLLIHLRFLPGSIPAAALRAAPFFSPLLSYR